MNIKQINHIGIVVADLAKATEVYAERLKLKYLHEEENKAYNCKIGFFQCGEVMIELIEPTGEGPSKSFLLTHGEGLHHVCYEVDDVEEALREAQAQKMTNYDKVAIGAGDSQVFFLNASSVCSVETEFVQLKK